ncbi:hypothetical protein MASR1M59_26950 [Melaminivora sp.]
MPDLPPNSRAIGQKDGVLEERRSQKWAAAVDLQPTISKSDRLLAAQGIAAGPAGCPHTLQESAATGTAKRPKITLATAPASHAAPARQAAKNGFHATSKPTKQPHNRSI